MTNVSIELPEEIAGRLAEKPSDLTRIALEALAAKGYRDGKLSHSEIQEMLKLRSRWETDIFLKEAGAYLDYDENDLENDISVHKRITSR